MKELLAPVIGVAGSILQNKVQNEQSKQNIEHAAAVNYGYGEMAADSAQARTKALFNELYSPEAKVNQLKKAGLSVGLMYGQGGAGGTSSTAGAQGQGAGGQQGKQPIGILEGAELGLMAAQAKKLEAEAENIEKDTEKKGGEIKVLGASYEQILQETENSKLEWYGKKLDNYKNEIDYDIKKNLWAKEIDYKLTFMSTQINTMIRANLYDSELKEVQMQQIIPKMGQMYNEQLKEVTSKRLLNAAEEKLKGKQATLTEQQTEKAKKEIDQLMQFIQEKAEEFENDGLPYKLKKEQMKTAIEQSEIIRNGMLWSAGISGGAKIIDTLLQYGLDFIPVPKMGKVGF